MLKALTEKAGHMQDQMGISERWKAQGKKKNTWIQGESTFRKLGPDQEMQPMGLPTLDAEKVSTSGFPCKSA